MTLRDLGWLFPLLFMFHDFEEIVVVKAWVNRNRQPMTAKYPRLAGPLFRTLDPVTTSAFALGVAEEFVLLVAVTAVSLTTGFHALWIGLFVAFAAHLVVHAGQAVVLRRYVPGLLTSLACLPASVWILAELRDELTVGGLVLWSAIGLALLVVNLAFVHRWMTGFGAWIARFERDAESTR
jgi:hypothetical protein